MWYRAFTHCSTERRALQGTSTMYLTHAGVCELPVRVRVYECSICHPAIAVYQPTTPCGLAHATFNLVLYDVGVQST